MASPNLDEIVTTTLRKRSKKLADSVSENTALLYRLKEKGNNRLVGGGRTLTEELEYAENSTYKRYSGYETLDISPSDVFTAAEYNWKQAAVAVSMSGLERLQNSGDEAIIDLLDSRIKNAEKTMMNNLSADIYSDGTATNQVNGLQALIADDPTTGTVGGINRATWSFWRNQVVDFSTDIGAVASASNIQEGMQLAYLNSSRNRDHVDLIVMDNNYFRFYWESLTTNQRFVNEKLSGTGFDNLKFMNADVVFDGGQGGDAPASHGYGINTDYLKLKTHRDRNFEVMDDTRFATNQDAMVKLIGWAGNLCMSNAELQFVMKD